MKKKFTEKNEKRNNCNDIKILRFAKYYVIIYLKKKKQNYNTFIVFRVEDAQEIP